VKEGRKTELQFDVMDFHDEATGFGAMERMTGFPAAIVCEMVADGLVVPGAHPLEKAIPGGPFVAELKLRGIPFGECMSVR
jgi:hypothetical protein